MSVVSSDDAPEPLPSPLPLSSLFLTHWPATCSLFLLPITRSSVFCASCYMSMSLVIKNALWLSHVLVYWIKENPNIIVINTNNITIQRPRLFCFFLHWSTSLNSCKWSCKKFCSQKQLALRNRWTTIRTIHSSQQNTQVIKNTCHTFLR